ncbi:Cache 3/Cache 2 fusion domain-containing protein [Methanolobus profundi]|uniref:Methyl-accepting chemotaxis protein (MCP) signalling domain-containing protein n=1 Tax=Methanolobus profundi TaxID=487685 RepID=A0A1I4ULI5_9EURY|nr:Cache 3/Cache 2 fusion domain-containing protein [Methanolobus profundi]SFM89798.1 Methyl-accepting chemotaxis protein (MCP) signalling domain-containing protein [Methanolobus profundi]
MDLKKITISQKIIAVSLLLTILPVTLVGFYAYEQTSSGTWELLQESLENQVFLEKQYVESIFTVAYENLDTSIKLADKDLYSYGEASIINGELVLGGDHVVNNDFSLVDNIKKDIDGEITVFQVSDDSAVRISTTITDQEGERIVGTALSEEVYETVVTEGQIYKGRANVLGSEHLTIYEPIKNNDGEIIGILSAAIPEEHYRLGIKDEMSKITVGETGYVYVMDSNGDFIIHPTSEGESVIDHDFTQEIIETKEGTVRYDWEGSEKIASYTYYEPNDWYIVSSSYTEEFEGPLTAIRNSLVMAILIFVILGSIVAFLISRSISGGIRKIVDDFEDISNATLQGKLDKRATTDVSIDFEAIPKGFNQVLDAVIHPLNVAADYVDRISKGDIPPVITDEYHGDFNAIKNNLNQCIGAINALVSDANMLSAAAVDGKLDTRADASKHTGDYRAIVEGVNDTLDAVIGPLNVAAEYVDRIAHGDVPPHITDDYSGDFNEIKDNLNRCIDAINALVSDANMLSVAAVEGKLDTRADASKHAGDYRAIVEGVNGTLDAVIGPLNVAAEYVDRIAHGDVPPHISDDYSGDFNEIKDNLNRCIDAISALVSDANLLSAAAVEGKLDTRADASKHDGDFRAIVEGVNSTLDAVIGPLNVAAEYVDRIAHGDVPPHITDDYSGDFNEIKDNLNRCIDAISALVSDANMLSAAAVEGKLDTRADVSKHDGDFRAIVEGVNSTLDAVIGPLNVAADYVDRISKGDLPSEITDDYNGDFNAIKNNLNQCIAAINALVSDANMLSVAAVEGRLDTRADASKHYGDYRAIVEGVNGTLDAVIGPLNVAADYVDRISKGDLPSEITDDYNGDFNAIKNNLNQCICAINELVSDANMLSEAAVEGRLDTRADASKHYGDYRSIVEGVNNTLDAVIGPLNVAADYVDRISKGDLPSEITDSYNGDFNTIKNNLNQCICAINELVSDANMLSEAAVEGRLDTRADASKHNGDYRSIVEGVNGTLDAVIGPLNVAADYVDNISKGNIPSKITDSYNGDFNTIKNNLNTCIDAINTLVADANTLAQAGVNGQLDTRADTSRHQGDYLRIVEGVNECLDAVVGPVNEAARVITAYAEGDLGTRVTIDAKGDFKVLGDTLDGFGDTLQDIINDSCEVLDSISSNDLTRKVRIHGVGDFIQLTEGVENCRRSLNDIVTLVTGNAESIAFTAQEMSSSSEELAASAEQITSTVTEISRGTQVQSVKAEDVSNAMNDMGRTVQEVATNSEMAAQNAVESNTLIQGLGEMSRELKFKMEGIRSAVSDSSDVINDLDAKSNRIGEIVNLITSIADQTNLLALNAAIEAARAGEHGRGFAVVADEVRKLAEDSGNAAKQIADLIGQMQEGTRDAVSSMKKGAEEVDTGAESLERSVLAIGDVVEAGNTIVKMVQEIAAAAEEQSASIEEVTSSVEEVSAISEQSAAGAEEASASVQEQTASMQELSRAAQELAGVAASMQSVVSRFKLDSTGTGSTVGVDEVFDDSVESVISSGMEEILSDLSGDALV